MDMFAQILYQLSELEQDSSTPKHIREKIAVTVKVLQSDAEPNIRAHKALDELGDLADDNSVQAYTRTQIFNIVSLLESF